MEQQARASGLAHGNGNGRLPVRASAGEDPLDRGERLTLLNDALSRHEAYWVGRLAQLEPVELPYANRVAAPEMPDICERRPWPVPPHLRAYVEGLGSGWTAGDFLVAAFALYLARLAGKPVFDLSFGDLALRREIAGLEGFFATHVPLRVDLDPAQSASAGLARLRDALGVARRRRTYVRDVVVRYPELSALRGREVTSRLTVSAQQDERTETCRPAPGSELTMAVSPDGTACHWAYAPHVFGAEDVAMMQHQFSVFVHGLIADDSRALKAISLLSDAERRRLLVEWNDTGTPVPEEACIHHLFEAQAQRTPDAVAAVFQDQELTYRELDARAGRLASYLRERGVGPDVIVGVFMERSLDLLVGLLGVFKAGGAYLPLDPTYPPDRLEFMVEDAAVRVLLTQERLTGRLPRHQAEVVRLDADGAAIARRHESGLSPDVAPHHLAYVIYTSGSTGKPKGVMVEHRNAVNFFTGMNARLDVAGDGSGRDTWLAVTSLSFDISVLELLWTLTRGFKVVLYAGSDRALPKTPPVARQDIVTSSRPIDFSLFYFASDEGDDRSPVQDKYRLLIEGAKFADRHGFAAVWTPERHFHAFGGLYPNPAITGAAVAAVTERIAIRAGSCVIPLHHPIRVAEEWALVDNLSRGRVGISFASGWQPNDFVLAPHAFAERKRHMAQGIETVRRLWRGEAVTFPGPRGDAIPVRTLPRPVQPELPVWITAAGNPETYRQAGEMGAGVLTHLLGQSVQELTQKLAIYRQAWRDGGHGPGEGHVTLMLHTFLGDDADAVRETVRRPMKEYLRSSVDLIREAAWSFPTFKTMSESSGKTPGELFDAGALDDEAMDALLDHAFARYFKTSGLFGTPEGCLEIIHTLKGIGVDEVACLIDFGVDADAAYSHLTHLNRLKDLSHGALAGAAPPPVAPQAGPPAGDYSLAGLIAGHKVSHLQCTPSMAGMLLADEQTREALRPLQNVMIGGEAFPAPLAAQLQGLIAGDVINMYGPTETTVWSTTYRLERGHNAHGAATAPPPIGRPIANTELYILDGDMQPVPIGVPGELFIGGAGVVRGYLGRPELTAQRFIPDPFRGAPGARLYRTGDLARYRSDGNVEFLGRLDHQVKIRGYRIELGEIESHLLRHPAVREAVVIAREDVPGDQRLVAYVVPRAAGGESGGAGSQVGAPGGVDTAALRASLKEQLPDYMVPSHVVVLESLPLTPNAKIDRRALPVPDEAVAAGAGRHDGDRPVAPGPGPGNDVERTIAAVWQGVLNVPQVGANDNFFDLGGHSLLMVQVQQKLRAALQRDLSITDLFRFPTVRSLTQHLSPADDRPSRGAGGELRQSVERAEARREMLLRRRQPRPGTG